MRRLRLCLGLSWALGFVAGAQDRGSDYVRGNLIQLNDNGAWCWFQDERALFDAASGRLLVGSVAAADGPGGAERAGNVELTSYEPASGRREVVVLHPKLEVDDHDTPALLIRPDGRYLAMYAKHKTDNLSRWRVSRRAHEAADWDEERVFDWAELVNRSRVTYSNLHYLAAEKRTYNFVRAINDDPSILISDDQGSTWSYGGKLLTQKKVGYVNGYVRYASNGEDRIDFITTEHHPRDFNNSVYHGYVRGGKLHRSDGSVVDDDVLDSDGRSQTSLTKVFAANSIVGGETMTRAWTADLRLDANGNPVAILTCRANDAPENSNFNDHRFFYARFDGERWRVHPLAKAGPRLWASEQDYTGLGALDPHDPSRLFVSTPIDPRDGSQLPHHEIFEGATRDGGATWRWTPVTERSSVDNLRPIVPKWDRGHTAILWFRGTMRRSQRYDTAVVGVIEVRDEATGPIRHVESSAENTLFGTDGRVRTRLGKLGPGTYEVFAYFRGDGPAVGIRAGLSEDAMVPLRRAGAQGAGGEIHRAYVGRTRARAGSTVEVLVDDATCDAEAKRCKLFAGVGYAAVAPRRR